MWSFLCFGKSSWLQWHNIALWKSSMWECYNDFLSPAWLVRLQLKCFSAYVLSTVSWVFGHTTELSIAQFLHVLYKFLHVPTQCLYMVFWWRKSDLINRHETFHMARINLRKKKRTIQHCRTRRVSNAPLCKLCVLLNYRPALLQLTLNYSFTARLCGILIYSISYSFCIVIFNIAKLVIVYFTIQVCYRSWHESLMIEKIH